MFIGELRAYVEALIYICNSHSKSVAIVTRERSAVFKISLLEEIARDSTICIKKISISRDFEREFVQKEIL